MIPRFVCHSLAAAGLLLLPLSGHAQSPPADRMTGFVPGPTLADDLRGLTVPVGPGYAAQHPRLLFSGNDRAALQQKAREQPVLWNRVLEDARSIRSPDSVPTPDLITSGAKYWRIEKVESAALAWFVTGDASYKDGAVRWMIAHAKENVWGNTFRPNIDLVASWYLYHLSVAYDLLRDGMTPEDRRTVHDSLAEHARAIFNDLDPSARKDKFTYDQNHTYIPTVALTAAALALLDDVPESKDWLTRAYAVLRRCRYVLPEDGYYYEGFGYWTYALHWHARGAEMLGRATGENLFEWPALRDTWRFGLYLSLPGTPRAFDIGDTEAWTDGKRGDILSTNSTMLWKIASATGSGESRLVGDLYDAVKPETDYPASAFLWFDPAVKPASLDKIPPYHYFPDQDVVAWRSGWGKDATCYLFRCGPPLGHAAAKKLGQLKDWTMNAGHVHPDIGAFWMYAKGTALAFGTGYTAEKWTRDHNTLLIDDKGQGADGSYNNERSVPYADFDGAHIDRQFLSEKYGYVSGEFGSAYRRQVPGVKLRRTLLMTARWMLVVDEMEAEQEHRLTWLCHSDVAFQKEGPAFVARSERAGLAVIPRDMGVDQAKPGETTVMAGKAPGKGVAEKRGYQLAINLPTGNKRQFWSSFLVPLDLGEKPPRIDQDLDAPGYNFTITWANGMREKVFFNTFWQPGDSAGPATIKTP